MLGLFYWQPAPQTNYLLEYMTTYASVRRESSKSRLRDRCNRLSGVICDP